MVVVGCSVHGETEHVSVGVVVEEAEARVGKVEVAAEPATTASSNEAVHIGWVRDRVKTSPNLAVSESRHTRGVELMKKPPIGLA